jgi:hypothetical protein
LGADVVLLEDDAPAFCSVAAMEEVALSKTYENTRPDVVVIIRPRRAFLQFLHHNHTPSPLAGLCSAQFRATVSRCFRIFVTIEKVAACASFYWAEGLFLSQSSTFSEFDGYTKP